MCFTKCLVTNHFIDLRGGRLGWEYNDGLSRVFSHSAEKIRRGSSLFFRFSLVSKNVRDKKGAVIRNFHQSFCLTVPNHFVEESFCASENFGYRKIL